VDPSSRSALYGMRPSTGTTSRTGVVPISSSQDTTGPLGKSAWDVAVALEIMAGLDPADPYTVPAEVFRLANYTQFLDPDGFRGLRIGVVREAFFETDTPRQRKMISDFNAALETMVSLGATVLETPFPNAPAWNYTFVGAPQRVNNGTIQIRECFSL
jgi:amidase